MTVVWHDLFLGRPRSRRYPKFNIRRDIPVIPVTWGEWLFALSAVLAVWSLLWCILSLGWDTRLRFDPHFLLVPAAASATLMWLGDVPAAVEFGHRFQLDSGYPPESGPSANHGRTLPPLDVSRDSADGAVEILDGVCRGQRFAK